MGQAIKHTTKRLSTRPSN